MALLRSAPRLWVYVAMIAAAISILTMSILAAYALVELRATNRQLCQVSEDSRKIMRDILETSEELSLQQARSIQESIAIQTRTDELLALIPPIDCTKGGGPVELK